MSEIGYAALGIIPSFDGFQGKLERGLSRPLATVGASSGTKFGDTAGQVAGKRFGMSFGSVARKAVSLGLGAAVLKVGKDAVDLEAKYSTTMRQIGVATDAPTKRLQQLDKLAVKMGANTVFSANESADAMLELAKGGLTPAQIQAGALAQTLTLATAGGMQLSDAAGTVVNAMGAFRLPAKQAKSAVAALAGAANASSSDVSDIAMALAQAGTASHNAGLSVEETTAYLAAFSNAGIKGSDAGTGLRVMLGRLIPQTKAASKEMDRLGLFSKTTGSAFVDANGQFKSATEIAGLLHDKLGDLTPAMRAQALQTIFGQDAQRAANILTEEGASGIAKYIKATSDQTQAQKLAQAAMGGTAGSLERLRGNVETAELQIGKGLAPVVQDAADWLSKMLDKGDFEKWGRNAANGIETMVHEAKPFAETVMPAVVTAFTTAKDAIKKIAPVLKDVFDGFNSLPKWVQSTIVLSAGSAAVAKKLGVFSLLGSPKSKGGLGGSGSGLLGLLGRNKPIPVIVVNKGGLPGVGGGDLPGTAGKTGGKAAEKEAEALTKKGLKGGKLWLPILTAVTLGELSNKYAPKVDPSGHETQSPITTWAVDKLKGAVDKRQVEETTQAVIRQGGRWAKVNDMLDVGRSSADKLKAEVFDLGKKVDHVAGVKQTRFEAPNLLNLLDEVKRYGSMLDGLDRRHVRTFIESTQTRNRLGPSEGGGRTSPRSPGVNFYGGVHIKADTYDEMMAKIQRRTRQHALDGMP